MFAHEFGHFWVAKKMGMKVEEFGFGFPPKMFGWENATLNLALRGEHVDWNYGKFEATGGKIYEHEFQRQWQLLQYQ